MTTVKEIVGKLSEQFPEKLASAGDPVGLQIGDINATVTKVMTTLDVRPQVVQEAIEQGVDLIISHHPVMFIPAKNLDFADPQKAMYGELIKHGITVYSIHTNSDKAIGGSSDWQAEELGLEDVEPFCLDDDGIAIGRKGKLPATLNAAEFAQYVKEKMNVDFVRLITANNQQQISRVAFICGDGSKYWRLAVADGCDAFITGDIYYHTGHDIISAGLTVVDPGHYTEQLFKTKMYDILTDLNNQLGWQVELMVSQESTDPFQNIF